MGVGLTELIIIGIPIGIIVLIVLLIKKAINRNKEDG